ncbi:hypothetical protein KCP70_09815 [Salmonella enterica subsp. enterica]|nr:hypothetical protein KCP70_09815 [Salmonella enterica subsp. enterica]
MKLVNHTGIATRAPAQGDGTTSSPVAALPRGWPGQEAPSTSAKYGSGRDGCSIYLRQYAPFSTRVVNVKRPRSTYIARRGLTALQVRPADRGHYTDTAGFTTITSLPDAPARLPLRAAHRDTRQRNQAVRAAGRANTRRCAR